MILDMAPMLRGEIKCLDFDYSLTPEPLDGVTFLSDAHVMGQITNNGYMEMHLVAEVPYRTECARCLAPVEGMYRVELERLVAAPGTLSQEQIDDNVDKYVLIEGTSLDPDGEVRDEMIMDFPTRCFARKTVRGCARGAESRVVRENAIVPKKNATLVGMFLPIILTARTVDGWM